MSRRLMLRTAGGTLAAGALISSPVLAHGAPAPDTRQRVAPDWIDVTKHRVVPRSVPVGQALQNLVDDAPSGSTLYFPRGEYSIDVDVTVPAKVTLLMDQGAQFVLTESATLRVDCSFISPASKVFGGVGAVVGSFNGAPVLPQYFGALADGENDDAPAIRAAVDALWVAGGGLVHLPTGTYRLESTEEGYARFITARSRVSIIGDGPSTVLKAADGLNDLYPGGFNFIFNAQGPGNEVEDVCYSHMKFDGNGLNNLQPEVSSGPKAKNAAIGIQYGRRICVENITYVNNAGRQCLMFGSNRAPQTVEDLIITDCVFDTFAQGVQGNTHQNDHSVIYAQADRCTISNNMIVQPELAATGGGTGIEAHVCNATIVNNTLVNVDKAFNIVSTVTDLVGVVLANNVARGVARAVLFYSREGFRAREILVTGNVFEQGGFGPYDAYPYDLGFIDARVQAHRQIDDLTISNNVISYAVEQEPVRGTVGLVVGAVADLHVSDNRFAGFTGPAMMLFSRDDTTAEMKTPSRVVIQSNEISDCGVSEDPDRRAGIDLVSRTNLRAMTIRNNTFYSSSPQSLQVGIRSAVTGDSVHILGNIMTGVPTPYQWTPDQLGSVLYVDHVGTGDPTALAVPASERSVWVDPESGNAWQMGAAGWVAQ